MHNVDTVDTRRTDHPGRYLQAPSKDLLANVQCVGSYQEAAKDAHAIAVLTEWDEFKKYDYQQVRDGWCCRHLLLSCGQLYESMSKPAFIFDGRNILDHAKLREIGFIVFAIGKPLDPVRMLQGLEKDTVNHTHSLSWATDAPQPQPNNSYCLCM